MSSKKTLKLMNMSSEIDEVYEVYSQLTNMSYSELLTWSKNPCSRKASIGRAAINRNLKLKSKPKTKWNSYDVKEAKKAISFLRRHTGQKEGKAVSKDCPYSKRFIALKNWAFDPSK